MITLKLDKVGNEDFRFQAMDMVSKAVDEQNSTGFVPVVPSSILR